MAEAKSVRCTLGANSITYRVGEIVWYRNHRYRVTAYIPGRIVEFKLVEKSTRA